MDIRHIMGMRIKVARESLNMSQEELARKIGKTQKAVWEYEKGERGIRVEDVPLLAKVLDLSISELFGEPPSVPDENELQTRYQRLFPCFQMFLEETAKQCIVVQREMLSDWFQTAETLGSHKTPIINNEENRGRMECVILVGPPVTSDAPFVETTVKLHFRTDIVMLEKRTLVNFTQAPNLDNAGIEYVKGMSRERPDSKDEQG